MSQEATAIERAAAHMGTRYPVTWREIVYVNARQRFNAAMCAQDPLEAGTIELRLARANLRAASAALLGEVRP